MHLASRSWQQLVRAGVDMPLACPPCPPPLQVALRQELSAALELAEKLDRMFKLADEECSRLRVEYRSQEDDRQFLVRWGEGAGGLSEQHM